MIFFGNYYRVCVQIDVRKPLKNVVSLIRAGHRQLLLVKYERLSDWCSVCGLWAMFMALSLSQWSGTCLR